MYELFTQLENFKDYDLSEKEGTQSPKNQLLLFTLVISCASNDGCDKHEDARNSIQWAFIFQANDERHVLFFSCFFPPLIPYYCYLC